MKINLNNDAEFTEENVAKLIGSVNDSQHRQLRVTKEGIAFISDEVGNTNTEGLAFRYDTWCMGNDYVGVNAQNDEKWVNRVYKSLKKNWPNPTCEFIDYV